MVDALEELAAVGERFEVGQPSVDPTGQLGIAARRGGNAADGRLGRAALGQVGMQADPDSVRTSSNGERMAIAPNLRPIVPSDRSIHFKAMSVCVCTRRLGTRCRAS